MKLRFLDTRITGSLKRTAFGIDHVNVKKNVNNLVKLAVGNNKSFSRGDMKKVRKEAVQSSFSYPMIKYSKKQVKKGKEQEDYCKLIIDGFTDIFFIEKKKKSFFDSSSESSAQEISSGSQESSNAVI